MFSIFSYLYDEICNRIKYLISKIVVIIISGITDDICINYNLAKIRIDSCNSLLIEKNVD